MIDTAPALRRLRIKHERELSALRRQFRDRALKIVEAETPPDGLTAVDVPRLRRAMDPLYGEFYGRWNGDERALFYQLVVRQAGEARALASGLERARIASLVDGRVDLPFDRRGDARG